MTEPKLAENPSELTWVAKLPFVRDPVFIRQMSLVFVLPLLFVGLVLAIIQWPLDRESLSMTVKIVLWVGAVMLALYLLVIFGVLRGRQEIRYTLDAKGVREETAGPLKYMNLVKWLLVLSGKPTYVGIGLMAQGPKSERITWKRIDRFVPDPQGKMITLRKARTDLMVLHCTEENYEQVLSWVQAHVGG
ncbi:MAG: hypothetical protein Kow0063_17840 [Anaerolineae bacterium]